ncbi:MAG: hypothetical protein QHJ81_00345 [Anaerolineae bacterium]|nr:hypothetical protein [Anaerolineae bacterium]
MASGDLAFILAALLLVFVFSVLASRVEQALWRRCRRNPALRRLQQQITLGKAHCR